MKPLVAFLLLSVSASWAGDLLVTGATILPMTEAGRIEGHALHVREGRIHALIPPGAPEPPDCQRIDGSGLFLVPGLCDMHVHNWYEEEHTLFLAKGVTTVRNLWGTPMHLRWRREIESGARLGPRLFTSGPILDGEKVIWEGSVPVESPEAARRIVRAQAAAGYPAIKVYNGIRSDVYEALVSEARAVGMRVEGHVPNGVGLARVLSLAQDSIEHLEGYQVWEGRWKEDRARQSAQRTAAVGTWNCPTLVVYRKFVAVNEARALLSMPEMRYVPPRLLATWDPGRDFRLRHLDANAFAIVRRSDRIKSRTVTLLHEAGARLLLGTDSANPYVVPGWSAHEELALLVEAGLTPTEALHCATRNAGHYLKEPLGTIEVGSYADLLLLEADPTLDVRNVARIAGVIARGRWIPKAELERRLEEVAASYTRPRARFADLPPLPEGEVHRYTVRWNGLVVGEERFVRLADGTIHAQSVNDPPQGVTLEARIEPDGAYRLVQRGSGGERTEFESKEGGASMMAFWALLRPRLGDGAFEWKEFSSEEASRFVPVRIEATEEEARVFTVRSQRPDGTFLSRLTFDGDGVPVELVTELQQGQVEIRRDR